MLMKTSVLISILAVSSLLCHAAPRPADTLPDDTLRKYAAQMLIVGFKGDSIGPDSDAARYVRDLKVGGIILFDIDLTGSAKIGPGTSPQKTGLPDSLPTCADMPDATC